MYWKEIGRSRHFDDYHSGVLSWSDVIRLVYTIKNKRKNGDKIQIENRKFYILCKQEDDVLYVINVKRK